MPTGCGGSSHACWTKRNSSAPTASARCRGGTSSIHTSCAPAGRVPGLLSAGRIGQRDVRRKLQLARPGVVPDERPPHSRAVPVPWLLRRLFPSGMSHRLRQDDDALRGGDGALRSLTAHFLARWAAGVRCSAARRSSSRDPHWRDCIPFHEYFHGDNGAGLGASHQTGWTALVASLAQIFGTGCPHRARVRREGIRARDESVNRAPARMSP